MTRLRQNPILHYQPHPKQQQFHHLGQTTPERLFLAGNRCGKTYAGALEVAMHLTGLYPHWWQGARFAGPIQAWAASVTTEATRDILQNTYLGQAAGLAPAGEGAIPASLGVIPPYLIQKTTLRRGVAEAVDTVYIKHASGGISTLGFKSYDQGREKFQGTAREVIHLDEEPPSDIYDECLTRTLTRQGHVLLTMTPLQGMTLLCERFLNAPTGAGRGFVQASWADAPHLDDATKTRLYHSLSATDRDARSKGVPSLGSGRIFPVEEAALSIAPFTLPNHFVRVFGLDFGWHNPTAAVWLAHDREQDIVYLYDCYSQTEQPPRQHAAALQARGAWIPGVCDPAGQATTAIDGQNLIDAYASHGLYLQQADNSVESGLMQLLERMQTGRFKVFSHLQDWWREFRLYRRDNQGRVVKQHDHLLDATRYALVSGLSLARPVPTTNPAPRPRPNWRTV